PRVRLCFLLQLHLAGVPTPEPEYRFAPPRRWRFDWAWPGLLLAVEREGGVWTQGRHVRPSGFIKDIEKYNTAALLGWMLIRYTPAMERDGRALALVERAIAARTATRTQPRTKSSVSRKRGT